MKKGIEAEYLDLCDRIDHKGVWPHGHLGPVFGQTMPSHMFVLCDRIEHFLLVVRTGFCLNFGGFFDDVLNFFLKFWRQCVEY